VSHDECVLRSSRQLERLFLIKLDTFFLLATYSHIAFPSIEVLLVRSMIPMSHRTAMSHREEYRVEEVRPNRRPIPVEQSVVAVPPHIYRPNQHPIRVEIVLRYQHTTLKIQLGGGELGEYRKNTRIRNKSPAEFLCPSRQ
jgi:hypothetical protein